MRQLTMGSLFAGIGGFDLGFERAGFKTLWQVEIDPYCQKVLAKNFPEAERFGDIRECGRNNLKPVDVVCGGFPCQDISLAGNRGGIEAERSGLWSEYARIIRELRPAYALIENVAALVGFGLERVLCDLAALGFDAEWQVISAADVGALHLRERVWILASSNAVSVRPQGIWKAAEESWTWEQFEGLVQAALRLSVPSGSSGGVAYGIPNRTHRLRGLGNAVVPQIPEMFAHRIREALEEMK